MSLFETLKHFLESSSIHGLVYWTSTKGLSRLFWIFVVFIGFSGAGYIIHLSFQSWQDSPVKTTIETLPISEVNFPKITICPQRGTYTNLNYDLMQMIESHSVELTNHTDKLRENFIAHFQNLDYEKHLHNSQNTFEERNRVRNMYDGKRYIECFF